MAKQDKYIVGVDVGTSKICVVVGEQKPEGGLDVIGIGNAESQGLRKGVVVSLDKTVEGIRKATDDAELMAGIEISRVYVGISGNHIRGFNSRGVIGISAKQNEINREDIKRVIEAARPAGMPADSEIIHVLPQEFRVDDHEGILEPSGMTGRRLEVNAHIVTGSTTAIQNMLTCIQRAGLTVEGKVLVQKANAEAVLSRDEMEMGVALIDIGAGTTNLSIFERGSLWHTAVIPVGGFNFTNDIAIGLRTPIPGAEKIKKKYGCVLSHYLEEDAVFEVSGVGTSKVKMVPQQLLVNILQPRAEELFRLIHEEIKRAGYEGVINAGMVITGGGSLLTGLSEIAQLEFDLPARIGKPTGIGGLVDVVSSPAYSTAIGLIKFGRSEADYDTASTNTGVRRLFSRIKDFFFTDYI
ncbi:MAG: cell division protein FtsA [Acidobacteria bacterium]|nr:cell division protein FtsA [Acidobacteriota bacterium]MCB9396576.1 cell division protein FtsA [Acidobacteriota bacterium]